MYVFSTRAVVVSCVEDIIILCIKYARIDRYCESSSDDRRSGRPEIDETAASVAAAVHRELNNVIITIIPAPRKKRANTSAIINKHKLRENGTRARATRSITYVPIHNNVFRVFRDCSNDIII